MSEELDVIDLTEDVVFDESYSPNRGQTEYGSMAVLNAVTQAKEHLQRFVLDEFLTEIFTAATQLRFMLGDADGFAYELSEIIRTNTLVVAKAIAGSPLEYIIAALNAMPESDRCNMAQQISAGLTGYLQNISVSS